MKRAYTWPVLASLAAVFLVLVALPPRFKQWTPVFIREAGLHFGLDLVGGTQLDFRISEQEIVQQIADITKKIGEMEESLAPADAIASLKLQRQSIESQQGNIVEAIRTVLERRINALGVSEAVITPSYIGTEKHLLVECPGVVDTQACIDTVGKTIKLEFKEEFTEATEEYEKSVRTKAASALRRIAESGETLHIVAEDLSDELGTAYVRDGKYFRDTLPKGLEDLWDKAPGEKIYQREGTLTVGQQDAEGKVTEADIPGIFLSQVSRPRTETGRTISEANRAFDLLEEQEQGTKHGQYDDHSLDRVSAPIAAALRAMQPGIMRAVELPDGNASLLFLNSFTEGKEEMEASHILVAYKGATSADPSVVRSREEALARIKELRNQISQGEKFETLAGKFSDGPSGSKAGSLGMFERSTMVPEFSDIAFAMKAGEISDPVETAFGFHIIRADSTPVRSPDRASFEELTVGGPEASKRAEALLGRLQRGEVESMEEVAFVRSLFFSLLPTGWKDTPLDGKHFRTATVTLDPVTNIPVVQITFDDEGGRMFQELTARNIEKRIAIFVGGDLVSAPVVQTEISGGVAIITGMRNFNDAKILAQDLNTGAIPAPIYLAGQRTVEATLGATALQASLRAALIGIVVLMLFMAYTYRLLGVMADLALCIYAFLFYAFLKLPLLLFTDQYVVLTVAGMAGIILSIGMAVDANVLIFERMREELRKGKLLSTATEIGFKRAWPSIRDGNGSTLITCAILFSIGTSIVRGFAITLSIGVLLSMFTAIVITRWLVDRIGKTPLAERMDLFGVRPPESPRES